MDLVEVYRNIRYYISRLPLVLPLAFTVVYYITVETVNYSLNKEQKHAELIDAIAYGTDHISELERQLNAILFIHNGLEAYIKVRDAQIDSSELNSMLQALYVSSPAVRNIGVAEGTVLKYIYPLKGNEAALGLDYTLLPNQWPEIHKAIAMNKGTLAGPINLVQGGRGLVYRKPVFLDKRYWGLLSTVLDLDSLLNETFDKTYEGRFALAIRKKDKFDPTMVYGDSAIFTQSLSGVRSFLLPNVLWEYAVGYREKSREYSILDTLQVVLRILGIAFFGGLVWLLYLRRRTLLNKNQYVLLSNNIADVIWLYNVSKGRFLYVSPSVSKIFGFTPSEMAHKKLRQLFNSSSSLLLVRKLKSAEAAITAGTDPPAFVLELQHASKGGQYIWVELSARFQVNASGHLEMVGVVRNIEARIASQQMIKGSQRQLDAIVNSTLTGISIIDEEGMQVFTNRTAEQIHGFSSADFKGQLFSMVLRPEDRQMARKLLRQVARGKRKMFEGDCPVYHKNGELLWLHCVVTHYPRLQYTDRNRALIVYQNISKQKQIEAQLRQLNATKDRFFSIIAHDLKNPFLSIQVYTRQLKELVSSEKMPDCYQLVENIERSAKNTFRLLENLLTWSQAQTGHLPYKPEVLHPAYSMNEAVMLMDVQARAKSVSLEVFADEQLAAKADSYMLDTILRNLVSNAIKFTPKNGKVRLSLEALSGGALLLFSVTDSGVGMSAERLAGLFEIDKNSSTPGTNNETGTGLGLILCKEFVEKQGGFIWAESKEACGSTFNFTLPRAKPIDFSDLGLI